MSTEPGVLIAVTATLLVYSYLIKENPLFRFIEHLYVGVASGHAIAMAFSNVRDSAIRPLSGGNLMMLAPLCLGLLFYAKYVGHPHLVKLPVAALTGIGAGTALRSLPGASVLAQVRATVVPLTSIDNVLLVTGVVSTLAYFLFTTRQGKTTMALASTGKAFMMVTFGASFGATVFAGHSLIVGSLQLLLGQWLGILAK